jgi:putative transposase
MKENVYIHLVFTTKYRVANLSEEIIHSINQYLKEQSASKPFSIVELNGFENHIHCLIECHPSIYLPDAIKWLKGSSSRWLNQQRLLNTRFSWGIGYYAARVDQIDFDKVVRYIQNQKINHLRRRGGNDNSVSPE